MCHSCSDEDESDKAAGSFKRTNCEAAGSRKRRTNCEAAGSKPGICDKHGLQFSKCKECGGSGLCKHGRRREMCKECGGASICQHERQRSQCKDCLIESYGKRIVSHEENGMQGKVAVFGSAKHWIHYTDGSARQLTTIQLKQALQPDGTAHCCIIWPISCMLFAHSQHQHTVSISRASAHSQHQHSISTQSASAHNQHQSIRDSSFCILFAEHMWYQLLHIVRRAYSM